MLRRNRFLPLILALSLSLSAFMPAPEQASQSHIVMAYVQAFNDRDIEQISTMMHTDIEWIDISGSTQSISFSGKSAMVEGITAYFASGYNGQSEMTRFAVNGNFVSGVETVSWQTAAGQNRRQSATVVYQLEDGLIRRVWYFAAVSSKP
ncbi:MAG: nuclear transport factor 2 family protein [Aquisalinus sp.]|nr:nuclear transport factor 2 family protein [Aquisalinus sp.]